MQIADCKLQNVAKMLVGVLLLVLATNAAAQSYTPEVVLRKYVQGDADGKLTNSEGFHEMSPLFVWPDAPGWDTFTVINDYAIGKPRIHGARASIVVTYTVLGELDSTPSFRPADQSHKKERVEYVLLRSRKHWTFAANGAPDEEVNGPPLWRVEKPQLQPHISLGTAKKIATDWRDHPFDAESKPKAEEVLKQLQELRSL